MSFYSLQALLDATGFSMVELRKRCPMNGPVYRNAMTRGLLPDQADRWAVACGLHPSLVWPDWFDAAAVECAERSCTVRFVPSRKGHRYCSRNCREREGARNRYQTDSDFRANELARRRVYYAECGEYVRHRERVRYQARNVA